MSQATCPQCGLAWEDHAPHTDVQECPCGKDFDCGSCSGWGIVLRCKNPVTNGVPIEPIQEAIATLTAFNALDLAAVTLTEHGQPLPVTAALVAWFRFTGLANKDFVTCRLWEPENVKKLMGS